jgi:hypothetical protein
VRRVRATGGRARPAISAEEKTLKTTGVRDVQRGRDFYRPDDSRATLGSRVRAMVVTTGSLRIGRLRRRIRNRSRVRSAHLGGVTVLALDRVVHLLAVNGDRLRCIDTKTDFVTTNVNDCHHNIVADHDAFVSVAGKD